MDKCKYYLNLDGTNLVFESDKELTEFIGKNIIRGSESTIPDGKSEVGSFNVEKTTASNGEIQELKIYLGEFDKLRNSARLVKNYEGSKEYSVHFGNFKDNLQNAASAMKILLENMPEGASIVQWGSLSEDAIALMAKVGKSKNFTLTKSDITLKLKDGDLSKAKALFNKLGLDVNPRIAMYNMEGDIRPGDVIFDGFKVSKSIQNLRIKFSKVDASLMTTQEKVIAEIKAGVDPYSANYTHVNKFLGSKHLINDNLDYLSPVFIEGNYTINSVEALLKTKEWEAKFQADEAGTRAEVTELIKKELALDNRMLTLSTAMSELMKSMITLKHTVNNKDLDNILNLVARYNTFEIKESINKRISDPTEAAKVYEKELQDYITANFTNQTKTNIKIRLEEWYKNINNSSSEFLGNVQLTKALANSTGTNGIYSFMSYIGISPEGVPSIYDIKVSRKPFKNWHSAKVITEDYKLGINKQLLENIANTSMSSLSIVPVIFPEKDGKIDANAFYIDNLEDRSRADSKSGLEQGGKITEALIKLIPAKIKLDETQSNDLILLNKEVLGIMYPKYDFRTKVRINDVKHIFESAVKSSEGHSVLSIYDAIDHVKLTSPNTPEGKVEFEAKVKDYVERAAKAEHSQVLDLVKAILTAKSGSSEDKRNQEIKFGRRSIELQNMFNKYLSDEWELVVNRPELLNSGILVFRNNRTLTFEVVSLTVNRLNQVNNLGLGDTLMGKFKNNAAYKGDDKVLKASNEHIEIMKALTVLNNNPELMKGYSLNKINVFNSLENKGGFVNLDLALYNFNLLLTQVGKFKKVPNNFNDQKNGVKISNFAKVLYSEIMTSVSTIDNRALKAFAGTELGDLADLADNKQKLDWLLKLREELVSEYKKLTLADQTKIQDFNDPVEYLFYLVSQGITYYAGINGIFDYETPQYGLRTGDALHWVRTLMFGSAPEYDKNGNKIVGLFQGQHFNTTDALESTYMTKIHGLINIAQNKISSEFRKRKNIMVANTNKYYKSIGRSGIEQHLIGDADQYHTVFFETYDNGKITKDFKLKNPWDMNNSLNTIQREYLKNFIYNQYISRRDSNISLDTLEKFEKSSELVELKVNGKLDLILKVPLIKSLGLNGWKTITTEGVHTYLGQVWDSMKNSLDTRDLTGIQRDEERQQVGVYEAINGFKRMYNMYDAQESEELRSDMIDKYGVTFFEVNLDTISLKYAYESLREKHYNDVLPIVQSALTAMKFYGWKTGKIPETNQALEDAFNLMKVTVFNTSPIKGKEVEEALGLVRSGQHLASAFLLMFRPTLMIKELVVGTIKNASYAWSKVYGDDSFTGEHLTKAYGKLFKSEDYNLIYELNSEYRIANRDLNQIVEKAKVDKYGINFLGQYMYWFNTAPDYVNRMSLFLAKMIKDGTYDAHSIGPDGDIIYDPSKDDRYSYYFKMRGLNDFKFHATDTKYNDQRSLYLTAIDEFNGEMLSKREKTLTEKDNIPRAYFIKEKDNMKTFADTAYGYYDSDKTPLALHLPYGIVFGQFLKFWPAKVKYYFAPPGKNSTKGYMNHKHRPNDSGGVDYYYVKYEEDPDTKEWYRKEVKESELLPTDPRAKAWEWIGEPSEGLMYSLGLTARELLRGENIDPNSQRARNAKVMLHDIFMAVIAAFLGQLLTSDASAPKAEQMGLYERIIPKIMYRATSEYNPFTSVFGVINVPPFLSVANQAYTDLTNVVSGDTSAAKFLSRNVRLFELIPTLGKN